jgi:hypothetical protein
MPRRLACLMLFVSPLLAHMVSMSSGDLRLEGSRAVFELRMPLYELTHLSDPEKALLDGVQFRGARLITGSCVSSGEYVCMAQYEFPAPPAAIEVRSRLHEITVANHVHLLRATGGDKTARAVLDMTFPTAELRFQPPTPGEIAVREILDGAMRVFGGWPQLLFLVSLVLAARTGRELWQLTAMFLLGEIAAAAILPHTSWVVSPRFVEAACALTVAYLALEILALPAAGHRWLVAGFLGLFHGLYFAEFLRTTGYSAGYVMAGAATVELLLIGLLWILTRKLPKRPLRFASTALLIIGIAWFAVRLGG